MYGSGIIPLAITPTNQYGVGLFAVGPFGIHSLMHGIGPQLPGFNLFGQNMGMPGSPFGMLPNLGQPGGQFGGQIGPFGGPQFGMGQPQFGPYGPYGMGQGMFGMSQIGSMAPNIGGRQVMRTYMPSAVGIVPIDIVV